MASFRHSPYAFLSILDSRQRLRQLRISFLIVGLLAANSSFGIERGGESIQDLMDKGRWEEVAVLVKESFGTDAPTPDQAFVFAKALVHLSRRGEALAVINQAAKQSRGGAHKEVVRRLQVIARVYLTNESFQKSLEASNLLSAHKFGLARERFEKLAEIEPDNVEVLLRIAQTQISEGEGGLDAAVERLRLAKKLDPFLADVDAWLGRALYLRGEINPSLDQLKGAAENLPNSEPVHVWYAEALASAGQRGAAIQYLDRVGRTHPLFLDALTNLARLRFSGAGRDKNALWSVRKDLQLLMSRMPDYLAAPASVDPDDLGLDLRNAEDLKRRIDDLVGKVDARVAALTGPDESS